MIEVTTVQKVDVSFNSEYVTDVAVYKVGHVVSGYLSFLKSTTESNIPIITNLPKAIFGWGAVVTPFRAHFIDGNFIRVHMNTGETVLNLHYSTLWEVSSVNEAELSFTYITSD